MTIQTAPRRQAVVVAALGLAVALALGACTAGSTGSAGVSSPEPASPSPTIVGPTDVPTDPGASPAATLPGQSDTAWGRIWDAVPATFPTYPGQRPTETGEGPASAVLDVGDADPAEVASFYRSAFEFAGYATLASDGPREDGSFEIESTGETTCRILTTITPMGGSTIVTILYRSDCPFEQ